MAKLLSVIVPSYNMEKYLHKCLGSFGVEQLMERKGVDGESLAEKLEVIVVNDGSKDRTSEIAHEFERKFPSVYRVIDKENGNHGSCVNVGLAKATGTFVRILDADDTFDSKAFADYLAFVDDIERKNPEVVDLIVSDYVEVGPDGTVLQSFVYGYPVGRIFSLEEIAETKMHQALSANCYRTANVRAIGYRQTEKISYSDNEWRFVPMMTVRQVAYFPRVVYCYLIGRPGQSMQKSLWRKNAGMLLTIVEGLWTVYESHFAQLSQSQKTLLTGELRQLTTLVYSSLFLFAPVDLVVERFATLDERVERISKSIYVELADLCICAHYRPIYYVKWARQNLSGIAREVRVIRILNAAIEFLARLLGRRA